MNVYLIGFMGAGKTAVSKALSRMLPEYALLDTDAAIVEKEGMPIPTIFEEKGETYFRKAETELLRALIGEGNHIVSCGGGMVLREENRALMKEGGKTVLLTATPETILSRVAGDDNRPLLRGKKNVSSIEAMMLERYPHYEKVADVTVATDGKSVSEIATAIVDFLKTVC